MNSKRVFFVMLGGVGLMVALVIGAVVYGDILLHKQSNELVGLKLDNKVIESQQASLIQAKVNIQKYDELKQTAKEIVPQDKDQARVTREIVKIANANGIKISGITFPASTLGQAQPKPAAGSGTSGSSAATPTPTITQAKPVKDIKGLYQLDITVSSDTTAPVSYAKLINFLAGLEQNRRTAQVTQITIQPDGKNRSLLNFNLTITVYLKP